MLKELKKYPNLNFHKIDKKTAAYNDSQEALVTLES